MVGTIHAELHRAIVERRLRPGHKLREQALGELFGVSRATVRAALQRLELEGLVTIEPNKGASVSLPSVSEVSHLFNVRQIVEIGIVVQLCESRSPTPIKLLRKHVESEQKAIASGDYKKAIALLGEFHLILAETTGNELLIDFVKGIISRTSLVVSAFDDTSHGACRSDEHIALIDLIEAGDVAGAIACVQAHLREIEAATTARAQKFENGYHPMQHLFGDNPP